MTLQLLLFVLCVNPLKFCIANWTASGRIPSPIGKALRARECATVDASPECWLRSDATSLLEFKLLTNSHLTLLGYC
jgi:hypothetical protein